MSKRLDQFLEDNASYTDLIAEEFECDSGVGDTMLVRSFLQQDVTFEVFRTDHNGNAGEAISVILTDLEQLNALITVLSFVKARMDDNDN